MATINGTNGNDDGAENPALQGTIEADILQGRDGDDSLFGGAGDDTLSGDSGADQLFGEGGDDILVWSVDDDTDTMDGGDGIDTVEIVPLISGVERIQDLVFKDVEILDMNNKTLQIRAGQADLFTTLRDVGEFRLFSTGTTDFSNTADEGDGRIVGTSGSDIMILTGFTNNWEVTDYDGDDSILMGSGNDTVNAGNGNDTIDGGAGDDELQGTSGDEHLIGGDGDDLFRIVLDGNISTPHQDTLDGGAGTDTVYNHTYGALTLHGTTLIDVEVLWAGSVYVNAGQLESFTQIDNLSGFNLVTEGTTDLNGRINSVNSGTKFYINGSTGTDVILAQDTTFDIQLNNSYGDDSLYAGSGNDTLQGGGANLLDGGAGDDSIEGREGNDTLIGGAGNDTLHGGGDSDTLNGGDGDDLIKGGGNASNTRDLRDVIYAGAGNDTVDAGSGNDLAYGGDGNDSMEGGAGVDELIGQAGNDTLTGSNYSDLLFGGDGDDFINGGFGYDRVNGGAGADEFYHIGDVGHGSDWIQDFTSADGDVLVYGAAATKDDFLVQRAFTPSAGDAGVQEVFVTHISSGVLLWALVDGDAQTELNVRAAGQTFDLLS
jgi:Ca2+-binding RTX toxin-like protein